MEGAKQTILVPVDFQDASLEAVRVALDLAARLGMEVVLMHVYTIPVVAYPGFDPIMAPTLPAEIEAAAKRAVHQLAASMGSPRVIVCPGDPTTEILREIEAIKPAFVAMGTHGRKGLSHFFMGSVAEQVIRGSRSPVITVHAPPAKEP